VGRDDDIPPVPADVNVKLISERLGPDGDMIVPVVPSLSVASDVVPLGLNRGAWDATRV
jgi:hypothetical protein